MSSELPRGRRLAFALPRKQSRLGQIGCTFFLALLLGGLGWPIFRYPATHPEEKDMWLMYVVGGGFLLFSLPLLYSAIHQSFALRTRLLTVEVDANVLARGANVQFFFSQPGPVDLESLRANLVGEERKRRGKSTDVTYLGTFNFLDQGPVDVAGAAPLERTATLHVPESIPPSLEVVGHSIRWKIEVWGKVRGRADFQHVYEVEVT
jgi:hypothetical protein